MIYQVHNDILCLKRFGYLYGGKEKLNMNFLSITLGYLVKNVQMKSYHFIINRGLFHPTNSMALRAHWYIREKMNWIYSIKNTLTLLI